MAANDHAHKALERRNVYDATRQDGGGSRGWRARHYDADFERIAGLTGQPARWIVPRGSVA